MHLGRPRADIQRLLERPRDPRPITQPLAEIRQRHSGRVIGLVHRRECLELARRPAERLLPLVDAREQSVRTPGPRVLRKQRLRPLKVW